jgi:hypothetical protein
VSACSARAPSFSSSRAVFIPIFALPLFVDPIWWADRFGWETEGPRDLVVYFGRCLGALALAIMLIALRAARDPAALAVAALLCRPPRPGGDA